MKKYRYNFKKYRECVDYYKSQIASPEFVQHQKETEEKSKEGYDDHFIKQYPHMKKRTDFFENSSIGKILFCDILSNDGVNKLLKCLYNLSSKHFRVHNYYKEPTFFHKYDYIRYQYSYTSVGLFAEIEFLDDDYISNITIHWSQINNYFACFEYEFQFKKRLDTLQFKQFVEKNFNCFTKRDYFFWHNIHKNEKLNYTWMEDFEEKLFPLICQHYITTYLYSEQGCHNPLLNLVFLTREEELQIEKLNMGLSEAYYNKKHNYVIIRHSNDETHFLLSGNNLIPNFRITPFIFHYGNEFYYKFFGMYELYSFEFDFSKYATGRKKVKYNRSFVKLLTKMQSITDENFRPEEDLEENFDKNWVFYFNSKKTCFKDFYKDYLLDLKKIYEKNITYLKTLTELNYTKSNARLSVFTIILSVIATVASVVAIFAGGCG